MKLNLFLTAIALVSASAQTPALAARPAGTPGTQKPSLQTIASLEKEMDGRIAATGANDPCYVVSGNRGVYVTGFGVVFTSDVDLINSPGASAVFGAPIGAPQKADTHKRKLAHVALLQQSMREMVQTLAASPTLKLADNEQVVVVVRLVYRPWEDMSGLPGQITARLERRGGQVITEVQ